MQTEGSWDCFQRSIFRLHVVVVWADVNVYRVIYLLTYCVLLIWMFHKLSKRRFSDLYAVKTCCIIHSWTCWVHRGLQTSPMQAMSFSNKASREDAARPSVLWIFIYARHQCATEDLSGVHGCSVVTVSMFLWCCLLYTVEQLDIVRLRCSPFYINMTLRHSL